MLDKNVLENIHKISQIKLRELIEKNISPRSYKEIYGDPASNNNYYKNLKKIESDDTLSTSVLRQFLNKHIGYKVLSLNDINKIIDKEKNTIEGKELKSFDYLWNKLTDEDYSKIELDALITRFKEELVKEIDDKDFKELLVVREHPQVKLIRNFNQDFNLKLDISEEQKKTIDYLVETFDLLLNTDGKKFLGNADKIKRKIEANRLFLKLDRKKIPIYLNKNIVKVDWDYNRVGPKAFDLMIKITTFIQLNYGENCSYNIETLKQDYDQKIELVVKKIKQDLSAGINIRPQLSQIK